MQRVYELPDAQVGVGDACMYGKRIPTELGKGAGLHVFKQHKWLVNNEHLLRSVCRTCDGSHEHYRSEHGEHVHGHLTKWSGEYTPQMARSILSAVKSLLAQSRS